MRKPHITRLFERKALSRLDFLKLLAEYNEREARKELDAKRKMEELLKRIFE